MSILIVDDNEQNVYQLQVLLSANGFGVMTAANGAEALAKARLSPPELIVSDILMPVMDGFALCREWMKDERLRAIPFIFYTATYTDPKHKPFALSLGADRFIVKPQEPDVLLRIIREVLDSAYEAKQVAARPFGEEMEVFRQHNEILFKKLEKKMSDLEAANQQLQKLEERYRLTFQHVTDVIFTIDSDLRMSSVSPSIEKMLGYRLEDFRGRRVSDLAHTMSPESFQRAVGDIMRILRGETISSAIYDFVAGDGTIRIGEVSGSPILRDGRIIGLISVARDITGGSHGEALKVREKEWRTRP
jgi:PAS domain S-box-containing protein